MPAPTSHTIRTKDSGTVCIRGYTRSRAIKLHCMECMGWDSHPRDCSAPLCPLFPFRGRTLAGRQPEAS